MHPNHELFVGLYPVVATKVISYIYFGTSTVAGVVWLCLNSPAMAITWVQLPCHSSKAHTLSQQPSLIKTRLYKSLVVWLL